MKVIWIFLWILTCIVSFSAGALVYSRKLRKAEAAAAFYRAKYDRLADKIRKVLLAAAGKKV